jgi:hypothetical protein
MFTDVPAFVPCCTFLLDQKMCSFELGQLVWYLCKETPALRKPQFVLGVIFMGCVYGSDNRANIWSHLHGFLEVDANALTHALPVIRNASGGKFGSQRIPCNPWIDASEISVYEEQILHTRLAWHFSLLCNDGRVPFAYPTKTMVLANETTAQRVMDSIGITQSKGWSILLEMTPQHAPVDCFINKDERNYTADIGVSHLLDGPGSIRSIYAEWIPLYTGAPNKRMRVADASDSEDSASNSDNGDGKTMRMSERQSRRHRQQTKRRHRQPPPLSCSR